MCAARCMKQAYSSLWRLVACLLHRIADILNMLGRIRENTHAHR